MCGIFGRFAYGGSIEDCDALVNATELLAHRGPDEGTWWMDGPFFIGHRRLSIIDLELGSQPMGTTDGRYVVAFNGEIYNYLELRDELVQHGARFNTLSDTEVLLLGYRYWGADLPRRLVGMFAFAIVDRIEMSVFLARDRFGEKPLFLTEDAGGVTFASELRAIAALPDFRREINRASLGQYLCLNYVPGEQTLLKDVRRLPPGTWRRYRLRTAEAGVYWRPPIASNRETVAVPSGNELAELRLRIDRSVRIALRSDVPITLFLSGGIDSSIIAESAVRQGHLETAYCLDFAEEGFSEMANAATVAAKLGLELRRVALTTSVLSEFSDIVEHADDPLADSSALAVWTLAKAVARDYKVAVSGDGGDEMFAGYLTYKATRLHQLLAEHTGRGFRKCLASLARFVPVRDGKVSGGYKLMRFLRAADLTSGAAHFSWNGAWLPADALRLMVGVADAAETLQSLAQRHGLGDTFDLAALQRADATDYLPNDILAKVDRMTMAHGLEARAPLLIPDIAEFGLALPDRLKQTRFGQPKQILRRLATEIYGPEIGAAKKQGFSIPVHRWIRGPMREIAEDLLSRSSLECVDAINVDEALNAKTRHMEGKAQLGFELWGLMVLVEWHRMRIQRAPSQPVRPASTRRIELPSAQRYQANLN